MKASNWREGSRIIWAIATKDIVDAIRNKTTLSILLGATILMLSSMALPLLLRARDTPVAVVYDPGRSTWIRGLTTREEFRLRLVDSQAEMEGAIGGTGELALGLVIPEGFREAADAESSPVDIAGYVPHWADRDQVARLVVFFENELSRAKGQRVTVKTAGHIAYPTIDVIGYPHTIASSLIVAVMTVGLALVPLLLLEEREMHTFDALLVSPARYRQIVIGKALVGLFYCLCAGAVVLALNSRWIARWWPALFALLLGSSFTVMLGLLFGSLFEDASSLNVWMALMLGVLLVPVFLVGLGSSHWSDLVRYAVQWLPSVAMDEVVWASMANPSACSSLTRPTMLLIVSVAVLFVLVTWRVRQLER